MEEEYKKDAKALLSEVAGIEGGQKEDISKIIDKLRDKTHKYDLSFIKKEEKEFLLELIVLNKLVFKKSTRIPEIVDAYLDLSKSQDGQFMRTISELYRIENNSNSMGMFGEMMPQQQKRSWFRR